MKRSSSLSTEGGFTLVETLLAILIISLVGILGSRSLLDSTRSLASLNHRQRNSSLAEMVFQQYSSYVTQNYASLNTYNVTNAQAKDFFNKSDNFGYDGITITTDAEYATNRSTATVKVTLNWNEGGAAKTAVYIKTYTESGQMGGGVVQVYVKQSCLGLTDPVQIAAQCPGLSGFNVTAPGADGSPVPQTTDANGQALLKNIQVGSAINAQISPPAPPSDYGVAITAPNYVPGYYAQDQFGAYSVTLTTTVSVQKGLITTVVLTNYKKTAGISGNVYNVASVTPAPPVDGLDIRVTSGYMAKGGNYVACTAPAPCSVISSGGKYFFNNVIPVVGTTYTVVGFGQRGSDPTIQPGQAGFSWGCVPDFVGHPTSAWGNVTYDDFATNNTSRDVYVTVMGWLNLKAIDYVTRNPVPNLPFKVDLSYTSDPSPYGIPHTTNVNSDASGNVTLYNMVSDFDKQYAVFGVRGPIAGTDNGYRLYMTFQVSAGQSNPIELLSQPAYVLNGSFMDSAGRAAGLNIAGWGFGTGMALAGYATVRGDNTFSYSGFGPSNDLYLDYPTTQPNFFNNPWPIQITLSNSSLSNTTTITGHTVDLKTGMPAPHTQVRIWGGNNPDIWLTSDATGSLGSQTGQLPYFDAAWVYLKCDNTTFTCAICPTNDASCVVAAPPPIPINTNNYRAQFKETLDQVINGYVIHNDLDQPVNNNILDATVPAQLDEQQFAGTVMSDCGVGAAGVIIYDHAWVPVATTDSSGHYGPAWLATSGAGRTSVSNTGSLQLGIASTANYTALDPATVTVVIPAQTDPIAPLPANFNVKMTQGCGGGGGM